LARGWGRGLQWFGDHSSRWGAAQGRTQFSESDGLILEPARGEPFLGPHNRDIERIDGQGDGAVGFGGLGTGPRDGEPPKTRQYLFAPDGLILEPVREEPFLGPATRSTERIGGQGDGAEGCGGFKADPWDWEQHGAGQIIFFKIYPDFGARAEAQLV
jgi:hypothetical protein